MSDYIETFILENCKTVKYLSKLRFISKQFNIIINNIMGWEYIIIFTIYTQACMPLLYTSHSFALLCLRITFITRTVVPGVDDFQYY